MKSEISSKGCPDTFADTREGFLGDGETVKARGKLDLIKGTLGLARIFAIY